jgi:hypothetical protein
MCIVLHDHRNNGHTRLYRQMERSLFERQQIRLAKVRPGTLLSHRQGKIST